MWQILQIWHLGEQKQTVEQYFQHCLTEVCSRGRAATVEGLYLLSWFQLRAFWKEPTPAPQERCHGLARCGHSTFLASHANPRVEATLLPALMRLVNGGCWMVNEELQGWVHVEVNRKCDSLLVQTNATRDHRQISLPHCLSATDDVTGIRPPPHPPSPALLSSTLLYLSSASLLTAWYRPG